MRELKFRVYIPDHEKFCYFTLGDFNYSDRYLRQHSYPVQQYTDLKDKNGKEIYEGDIVQYYYNDSSVKWVDTVVWQHYGWRLFHLDGAESGFAPLNFNPTLEIIGNIFENPELLGAKQLLR